MTDEYTTYSTTCDDTYPEYEQLYKHFGRVLIARDFGEYSGDTLIVLQAPNSRYGYLRIGWGSCSGCDALQACDTVEEIDILQRELYDSIVWCDSAGEMGAWLQAHDWKGDYIGRGDDVLSFVADAIAALESEPQP